MEFLRQSLLDLQRRRVNAVRVAIDYTPAYEQGGGIGRLVREMTAALMRQTDDEQSDQRWSYRLFVAGATPDALPSLENSRFSWRSTRINPTWFARIWHRTHIPLPVEAFVGANIHLYHATDFVLPPTLPTTSTIVTVHDLSFIRVPDAAPPRLKAYLHRVVPASVHKATHVIADSQATKEDLVDFYRLSPDKITVVLSGVEPRFVAVDETDQRIRGKYKLGDKPYILSVGTVQPRKNYARLTQALARLRQSGTDINLVIVGGKGWLEDPIYDAIRDARMEDAVIFTGFADDADLPALYTHARCVAQPSLYEGFGLPVLEAMGCGTPVVTSNISSLPEVAGDAALTVDPLDLDALTHALDQLIHDDTLRAELITRGRRRAAEFTWDRSAEQLRAVYRKVLTTT